MCVQWVPKGVSKSVILNCGCTELPAYRGPQSGSTGPGWDRWWCFCKIFPDMSNVQAGSRTSAGDRNKEETSTYGASLRPKLGCHIVHLIIYHHRMGTASLLSSSGHSFSTLFLPPPNISLNFKNELSKLSDKSL